MKRINALTIAGTDPSGGAGIQADLKTFSALGAYGCSVITALVAQNTRGVQSVYRIEPDFVAAQLDSVFSDVRINTTKIGMLAETDIVEAVAERLARYQIKNVVLDTVMLAKSGDPLLSASAVETLRKRLLPQVSLITPNLPEAAALAAEQGFSPVPESMVPRIRNSSNRAGFMRTNATDASLVMTGTMTRRLGGETIVMEFCGVSAQPTDHRALDSRLRQVMGFAAVDAGGMEAYAWLQTPEGRAPSRSIDDAQFSAMAKTGQMRMVGLDRTGQGSTLLYILPRME